MKKVIHDTRVSMIVHDTKKNILFKTLKRKGITNEWFSNYKKLQEKTPHIVKIIDKIDNHTYSMEYVNGIVDVLYKFIEPYNKESTFTKTDYIRLFKCINHTWTSALELSNEWADNRFFINQDAHLKNIAVIKNKNALEFKFLDADAWYIEDGFHGVDAFYTAQLKIILSMQRMLV